MKNFGWSAVAFTAASLLAGSNAPFVTSVAHSQSSQTAQSAQSAQGGSDQCISPAARAEVSDCHNGPNTATAQSTSGQRRQVPVHTTGSTPPAAAQHRQPGVQLDQAQVALAEGRQSRALAILRQEIQAVKLLVQTTRTTDPSRPEVIGRLAETYTEYQAALRSASGNLDEQIFCACPETADASCHTDHPDWAPATEAGCAGKQQEKTTLEAELARAYTEANATLAMLIRDHPTYPQLDRIMFSLAYGLERVGQTERAQQVYLALAERFPTSRYVPHAFLAFGEYFFNNNLMDDAQAAYERVLSFGQENNAVYGYAIFKLAWVFYNQNDYEHSLSRFEEALQYALDNPSSLAASQIVTECRRNIVMPYAMVRTPNRALRDFMVYARNDRTLALGMYEELALYFYDNGQWQNAIDGFKLLIAQTPDSVKVCVWQSSVVDATMRGRNNKQETVAAMDELGVIFRRFTADTTQPEAARNACEAGTAAVMYVLATQWHVEAVGGTQGADGSNQGGQGVGREVVGSRNPETMRAAAGLYQLLIDNFPNLDELDFSASHIQEADYPTRYRIAYYLADLYYQAEDWVHCGPAFELVTQINPTGEFTNDAAGAAVRCYIKVYETTIETREGQVPGTAAAPVAAPVAAPATGRGRRGRQNAAAAATPAPDAAAAAAATFQRREYTQLDNGMLRAFANFMCVANAESEDLVTIKYRRARVYYEANHYEEAAILFRDIAMNHKGASQDEFAANLYFDCLNALATRQEPVRPSCMNTLETDSPQVCSMYCSTDADRAHYGELCGVCSNLECSIKRQRAESLHNAHRYVDAANAYVDIVMLNSSRPENQQCGAMDELLYNAAIDYETGYQIGQAIQMRTALIENYPTSPLARKAIYLIGANYHAIAWYDQAADWYERFAREYPTEAGADCTPEVRAEGRCAVANTALMNATLFRLGLGSIDKAIEDGALFSRNYGRSMPYETAKVQFAIGSYYEHRSDWGAVVLYYTKFLHDYGRTAPTHLLLQAQVLVARAYRLENRSDRARETLTAYTNGVHLWETGHIAERVAALPLTDAEKAAIYRDVVNAAAEAYFYVAEQRFAAVQAIRFPPYAGGADDARILQWIQRDFLPWGQRRRDAVQAAILEYNKVAAVKVTMTINGSSVDIISPPWQIAAAARTGQMYREVVDAFRNVPVPEVVDQNPELYERYIGALEGQASPLLDTARQAFQFCLNSSTGARWFNEWSRQCESELARIDPAQYPAASELRGAGGLQYVPIAWPGSVELGANEAPATVGGASSSTEATPAATGATTTAPAAH